jgi:hypothetical protein
VQVSKLAIFCKKTASNINITFTITCNGCIIANIISSNAANMKYSMKYIGLVSLIIATIALSSCRKDFEGDRNLQSAPETFALVDSIRRDTANFLTTTVTGFWYGQSQIGFVVGYEVSTDNMQTWVYTTEQRGTFTLNLPFGVREGQLPIYIRAVDNIGQRDPTPAQMVFPVRNSSPRVGIDPVANPRPFNTFPIIRLVWNVSDIDGLNDIAAYEIAINDTTAPFNLPSGFAIERISDSNGIVAARIEAVRSGSSFTTNFQVFTGNRTVPVAGTLTGVTYNQINYIYIRAIDRTGNISGWAIDSALIREPVSDILVVNALRTGSAANMNYLRRNLAHPTVGILNYDTINAINTITRRDELYTDALTQTRVFSLFKKIIWLTDEPASLATCQLTTQEFFQNNGRMYIYSNFNHEFPNTAPYLAFTPIEFIISDSADGRFRLESGKEISPRLNGWPTMQADLFFNGVIRPFITFGTGTGLFRYEPLMDAQLRVQRTTGTVDWQGVSTVMARRIRSGTNATDIIISSLPFTVFDDNTNTNVPLLFREIFINQLQF